MTHLTPNLVTVEQNLLLLFLDFMKMDYLYFNLYVLKVMPTIKINSTLSESLGIFYKDAYVE